MIHTVLCSRACPASASGAAADSTPHRRSHHGGGAKVHVTLVEPGGTTRTGPDRRRGTATRCRLTTRCARRWRLAASVPGDPTAAARALLDIVDAEQPPLRVLFGALFGVPVPEIVRGIYDRRLKEWAAWEDLGVRAYGK